MRPFITRLLGPFVYSNLFTGVIGACFAYTLMVLLGVQPSISLLIAFGLIVFATYTINRLTDTPEDSINYAQRYLFIKQHGKTLLFFSVIGYLLSFVLIIPLGLKALVLGALPIIMGFLYSVEWMPHTVSAKRRLKEIFLFKNFVIAFTWAIVPVGLCIVYAGTGIRMIAAEAVFVFAFLKVFINTVVFDIRDVKGDAAKGIDTIPVRLGIKKTKRLLTVLNLLLGLYVIVAVFNNWMPTYALFVGAITIYAQGYLSIVEKKDLSFLFDLLVDGEDAVMATLAFIGYHFI